MRKITVIGMIATLFLIGACRAQEDVSLRQFVDKTCVVFEKGSAEEFLSLIKQTAQVDGQSIDLKKAEELLKEARLVQQQFNYNKIYEEDVNNQQKFISKGEFYLGGHKYGHLTFKLEKQTNGWLISGADHCR